MDYLLMFTLFLLLLLLLLKILERLLRAGNWNPSAAKSKSHYPKLSLQKAFRSLAVRVAKTKKNDTWHSGLTVHYFYTYFVLLAVYHNSRLYGNVWPLSASALVGAAWCSFPSSSRKQRLMKRTTQNRQQIIYHEHKLRIKSQHFCPKPHAPHQPFAWRFAPHSLIFKPPAADILRVVFRRKTTTLCRDV